MSSFYKIASYTVPSVEVTSYTFSNIPQTYTDLCVIWSGRGSRASFYSDNGIKINGNLTANSLNYQAHRYYNGSPLAYSGTDGQYPSGYDNGGTSYQYQFSNVRYYFFNYTSSDYKTVLVETTCEQDSATAIFNLNEASMLKNTAPITSLVAFGSTNNYTLRQNSVITLYGIKDS